MNMAAMGGHHRPKDLVRQVPPFCPHTRTGGTFGGWKKYVPVEKGCSCEVAMLVVFEALGQSPWFRDFDLKAYLLFFF